MIDPFHELNSVVFTLVFDREMLCGNVVRKFQLKNTTLIF